MKTLWNETRQMERYILGKLPSQETEEMEAKLRASSLVRMKLFYQKKVYDLLGIYHRKILKEEVAKVHNRLFTDPCKKDFQQSISQLFQS